MGRWKPVGEISKEYANAAPEEPRQVYDEAENGVPRPGPYMANLRRLQLTESQAGNDMFKMLFEIAEPNGSKKVKYNGYPIWFNRVISQEWAGAVNQLLFAMLDGKPPATRKKIVEAFWAKNVQVDDAGMVTKIGTFAVPETIKVGISTQADSYNGQDRLKVASVMPASNRPKPAASEDVDDVDDEDDDLEADEEAAGGYTEAELNAMKLAELRALARESGLNVANLKGKAALVDAILDAEENEDEDDEDAEEDEEADDEPEGDEYDDLNRNELKKVIAEEGLDIKVTRGMADDDIRAAIREALGVEDEDEPEEEEEPEPEPEPAKPSRRGRPAARQSSAARPAARRRRGKAGDEPPF
jgi:hypothetical protein